MSATVLASEPKDIPSLTVTVDGISSSSPFPSPGSSFLPPPVPGAHEFAIKSPAPKRKPSDARSTGLNGSADADTRSSSAHNLTSPPDHMMSKAGTGTPEGLAVGAVGANGDGPSTGGQQKQKQTVGSGCTVTEKASTSSETVKETASGHVPTKSTAPHDDPRAAGVLMPPSNTPDATTIPSLTFDIPLHTDTSSTGTITPPTSTKSPTTPTNAVTPTMETSTAVVQVPDPNATQSLTTTPLRSARDSLTSSRPAPPSPAASRRTSAALSRTSTRSRPPSTFVSTPAASSRLSVTNVEADAGPDDGPDTPKPPSTSMLVKIRDFAFPPSDARHTGTGPFTPRPNKRLRRPPSTWSSSSASSSGSHDEGEGDAGPGSWGGFGGWGLGRLSWFGGPRDGPAGDSGAPSEGDFARNFGGDTPESEIDDPYELQSEPEEDEGDEGDGDGERELPPGLYRALYAFEPEGTAEMALEEDQLVRVTGRGGGVGWAIAVREGGDGHALVPEGYLELVLLDRDDDDEEDEG